MKLRESCLVALLLFIAASTQAANVLNDELWSSRVPRDASAMEYYVAPDGKQENSGTRESPWDFVSAMAGKHPIKPGSVIWVRGGRYVFPIRNSGKAANGFKLRVSGAPRMPVHVRAVPGERATIDGGIEIDAHDLWVWDLEIALADSWRPKEPAPQGWKTVFDVPVGAVNIIGGNNVKVIDCISHNNVSGFGFWHTVSDGEMHGCIVYDNGFIGADRQHGPALYTQNTTGTPRLITDNIFGGGFSLALQCYGSRIDELVNNFVIEGNIEYAPRKQNGRRNFNQLGGELSKGMTLRDNLFYGYSVTLGQKADQSAAGNKFVRGSYSGPATADNTQIADPAQAKPISFIRPNKYDPRRANLIVSNWSKSPAVEADLKPLLAQGERFRVLNPFDAYGHPLAEGLYEGRPISIPLPQIPWEVGPGDAREVGVFVLIKK